MTTTKKLAVSLFLAFAATSVLAVSNEASAFSGQMLAYTTQQNLAPLQGRVVSVPSGTQMPSTLSYTINSQTARVGDKVMATLGSDITSGNSVVLPAGSTIEGQVVSVTKASRVLSRNGSLGVRFNAAIAPNGQRIPLSAKIATEDGTGVLKGGTTGTRVWQGTKNAAVGAGTGAVFGTAIGAISGSTGKGAVYGTAIGGGLGALTGKGREVELSSGQSVNIILDAPLTTGGSSAY